MSKAATDRAIRTVWQIESAKLIAGLTRLVRDVGLAEELAQDALVAALEHWPVHGVPDQPGAWLMAVAKNRGRNQLRRAKLFDEKQRALGLPEPALPDVERALDEDIGDDLLRLVFIACHPLLAPEARVALTLRLLCGLTTEEIARAFLVAEPTIAQRIVRAKRALSDAQVPFELPHGEARAQRLASVLEVIYLVFNEGYAATAGQDAMRPALVEEALRLGRVLAGLTPEEPEVHGLVALMELHASRMAARTNEQGEPVLLLEQQRSRWDLVLIGRGLSALARAEALGGPPGRYTLQAAISACHARARSAEDTDWPRIAALYGALFARIPSPIVALNRAVAVGMAEGPAAGLVLLDALAEEPQLERYHLLPAARGDLLQKLARFAEAEAAFARAAELAHNERERAQLLARGHACRR
ncbi:MAG TPA: RNA polymerase sigma factor [Polyangiales bacterium]